MSKIWLITGSANGLGRSLTERVLKSGDRVVATARTLSRLDDLVETFAEAIKPVQLDVTDPGAAQTAVEQALETFGGLDVLVNNAGYGQMAPFEQTSAEDFKAQIDTNFYGVVNLTRTVLPVMRAQKSGHIINISSVGGRTSAPGLAAYQAAKWAVGGFTEVIAKEVAAFGVKAISVEPGGMRTNWGQTARGNVPAVLPDYQPSVGALAEMLKNYIGNEFGDPEKVADVIWDLSRRQDLPAHLILGSDALFVYEREEAVRSQAAAEWQAVSRSTDFDGSDLSFLTGGRG